MSRADQRSSLSARGGVGSSSSADLSTDKYRESISHFCGTSPSSHLGSTGKLIKISSRRASDASISPSRSISSETAAPSSRIVWINGCKVLTHVNSKGADKLPVKSNSGPKRCTQSSYSSGPVAWASPSGKSKISFGNSPETHFPSSGSAARSIIKRPLMREM